MQNSASSLDFQHLKEQVPIGLVLAVYGLDTCLRRMGDQLIGPCPLHGGDNNTAFRVHLGRGIWQCFTSCNGGGDVVELIRRIEQCNYAQAALHLRSIAQISAVDHPHRKNDVSTRRSTFRPFLRRMPLNPRSVFLQQKKGITVDTAIRYEAGHADRSRFLQGAVAVRLHDVQGRPLGYGGRRLDPEDIARWGKWRFPKCFPKQRVLYNAHRAASLRRWGSVLVECPWAVMRLAQAGIPGSVALLGTHLTSVQIAWLAQARGVLVMLDGDAAGRKACQRIVNQLGHFTDVRLYHLPDGLEPEDLTDNQLTALVQRTLSSS
jgi:DNA primase